MNCPRCHAEMPSAFAYCGFCGASLTEEPAAGPAWPDGDADATGELEWADVRTLGPSFDRRAVGRRREPLSAARDMTVDLGKLRLEDWRPASDAAAEELDEADFEDGDGDRAARGADTVTFSKAPDEGAGPDYEDWDDDFDDPLPPLSSRIVEPEVVSPDAIAYLKRHRKGGRLIYVAIVAIVAIGALIGFSIWKNSYSPYDITEAAFPDAGVRAAVSKIDANGDGRLSREEIAGAKSLEVAGAESVSGLGIFTNLESLKATGEQLKSIDLAGLSALKELDISGTGLEELDLSPCPAIERLDAHGSKLARLSTADVPALSELDVSGTRIDELDVAGNPALASLACDDNVTVAGLEATGLEEHWVVTSYTSTSTNSSSKVNTTRIAAVYDDSNRLANITFMNSETTGYANYHYDEMGRLVGLDNGLGTEVNGSWAMTYDDAGRLVAATDNASGAAYEYGYDEAGRMTSFSATGERNANGYRTGDRHDDLVYDEAGRVVQIVGDDAAAIAYGADGRIAAYHSEDGAYACDFVYDPHGRCIAATRTESYNTIEESFFYDEGGRLTSATRDTGWSRNFESIENSAFTCDANGNITSATITGRDGVADTCTVTYKRIFATPDKAPVGITPALGDPLQYCLVENWVWRPWSMQAASADNDLAFVAAFHPERGVIDPMFGLPVIPNPPAAEKAPAGEGGEAAAPAGEGAEGQGQPEAGSQEASAAPTGEGAAPEES